MYSWANICCICWWE